MSKNTGTSELINYFTLGASGAVDIGGNLTLSSILNATTDTDKFLVSDSGVIKYRTGAELLSDIGGQVSGNYVTLDTNQTITGEKLFSALTLQLAAAGSASPTIIRNTSGTTGSTSGYNTIGFNSSNNIFVDTTNRGGFILGFNNSVSNRTYTLQDASGTLAFTSQIPANPVGGTGTTNYLPKFTGSTTIGNSIVQDLGYAYILPSGAEALRVANDNVFISFYNSANSTRRGYIQAQPTALTISGESGFVDINAQSGGMRLNASGNLSIGNTNDTYKLDVNGTGRFSGNVSVIKSSGGSVITAQSTATNGEAQVQLEGKNSSGTSRSATFKYDNADIVRIGTSSNIAMRFETNDTERMRITSGGNVGIGTITDAGYKLDVNGKSRIGNSANSSVDDSLFLHGKGITSGGIPYGDYGSIVLGADASYTSGARRFLITNGYISNRFAIIQSVDANTTPTLGAGGGINSGVIIFSVSNTGAAEFSVLLLGTSATFSSSVTATAFFQSSDLRKKDIIKKERDVVYYTWKDGEDKREKIGYIAQEIQKYMPNAVNEDTDGMLSVDYIQVLVSKILVMEKEIENLKNRK
jgi:hypothetical protein